jgi:pimeloyl-ACP methyl ester carboxylesterase
MRITMFDLLRLSLILLICGVGATLLAAAMMARLLLRPPRMTDGKAMYLLNRLSPADLGLAFEPVTFTVRDVRRGTPLNLAAWWLPAREPSGRTVVLLHGFADAKVGAIAWAPMLIDLNLNVLAIDLRAHGESGGSHVTAGFHERHDIDVVIDQLKSQRLAATTTLYLYGVSLGSAVAIATAALRDDVAGVVLDSPFADYRDAMRVHAALIGAPGGLVVSLAARFAEWTTQADFARVRPADRIATSRCPVLVLAGTLDPFVPIVAMQQAVAAAPAGSRLVTMDGIGHLAGLRDATSTYTEAVQTFLDARSDKEGNAEAQR